MVKRGYEMSNAASLICQMVGYVTMLCYCVGSLFHKNEKDLNEAYKLGMFFLVVAILWKVG